MKIALIAALDEGHVIGNETGMPWHLPADLRHFKEVTMGKPLIMGRTTWETIGKPLPGRRNIIVTRNVGYQAPGCQVANSVDAALAIAARDEPDEVMIIGGGQLYAQTIERADRLYLTLIQAHLTGDTRFPDYHQYTWHEISSESFKADDRNAFDLVFQVLERVRD